MAKVNKPPKDDKYSKQRKYLETQKRIIIWYPEKERDTIKRKVAKAKYTHKEVYEAGLNTLGIPLNPRKKATDK